VNQPDLNWMQKAGPRHSFTVCSRHCFCPKEWCLFCIAKWTNV